MLKKFLFAFLILMMVAGCKTTQNSSPRQKQRGEIIKKQQNFNKAIQNEFE